MQDLFGPVHTQFGAASSPHTIPLCVWARAWGEGCHTGKKGKENRAGWESLRRTSFGKCSDMQQRSQLPFRLLHLRDSHCNCSLRSRSISDNDRGRSRCCGNTRNDQHRGGKGAVHEMRRCKSCGRRLSNPVRRRTGGDRDILRCQARQSH